MSIKAVIFDLDGTITVPFLDFDAIRGQMGFAKDAGSILEVLEKLSDEQREKAEQIMRYHEQKAIEFSQTNEGVAETICELRAKGIGIGILTRNTAGNAASVLEKHGLGYDFIIGREDGPAKPDAYGVLRICQEFGIEPGQAIVVGDHKYDMLCAKAAGAKAVLLHNNDKSDEYAEHADIVIEKFNEILRIVETG